MSGCKRLVSVCVLAGITFTCNPTVKYGLTVEPVPKHADPSYGPHHVHRRAVSLFVRVSESHFDVRGMMRMVHIENERDEAVTALELDPSKIARDERVWPRVIDRFELVSLLTHSEPSVYVLDRMPTMKRVPQAKRRPLDEFERLGLEALQRGEELVWSRVAPTRMFGSLRAEPSCLWCHTTSKEGDLLGAFTYYLNTPVDQVYSE